MPALHRQLQARPQCSPPQLPALVPQTQDQPGPTYREPQDSRAQPAALLHLRTKNKEDLHPLAGTTAQRQQHGSDQLQPSPDPQASSFLKDPARGGFLNQEQPPATELDSSLQLFREELHLIAKDAGEPSPGLSFPQAPPTMQAKSPSSGQLLRLPELEIAGITQLLQDPEEEGPLTLEPPTSTLAKTDASGECCGQEV